MLSDRKAPCGLVSALQNEKYGKFHWYKYHFKVIDNEYMIYCLSFDNVRVNEINYVKAFERVIELTTRRVLISR